MATLEDNIRWVQDFNLNLGVNVLGGIFGVHEAFADPVKMLEEFFDLLAYSDELRDSYGGKSKYFNEAIRLYLHKLAKRLPEQSFAVLCKHYVPFYYEAFARLRPDPKFVDWVKGSAFSIMPDIFTKSVMEYAISKIEIREKIARAVSDSLSGQLLERKPASQPSPPSSDKRVMHDDGSVTIVHDDGSAALHTSDGAWIDYAAPRPSQLDRLATDAALEELRKSRPAAPWYAPVLGAAILVAALGALVVVFIFALKWYLRSQGI